MKFLRTAKGRLTFEISRPEKRLLFELLKRYPLVPEAYQNFSKSEDDADKQQLLEQALAEQRAENRKTVQRFLKGARRFRPAGHALQFDLSAAQVDWLLQVINDVRVGCWIALGCPGPKRTPVRLTDEVAGLYWTMELAGYFQAVLLEALEAV